MSDKGLPDGNDYNRMAQTEVHPSAKTASNAAFSHISSRQENVSEDVVLSDEDFDIFGLSIDPTLQLG